MPEPIDLTSLPHEHWCDLIAHADCCPGKAETGCSCLTREVVERLTARLAAAAGTRGIQVSFYPDEDEDELVLIDLDDEPVGPGARPEDGHTSGDPEVSWIADLAHSDEVDGCTRCGADRMQAEVRELRDLVDRLTAAGKGARPEAEDDELTSTRRAAIGVDFLWSHGIPGCDPQENEVREAWPKLADALDLLGAALMGEYVPAAGPRRDEATPGPRCSKCGTRSCLEDRDSGWYDDDVQISPWNEPPRPDPARRPGGDSGEVYEMSPGAWMTVTEDGLGQAKPAGQGGGDPVSVGSDEPSGACLLSGDDEWVCVPASTSAPGKVTLDPVRATAVSDCPGQSDTESED